MVTTKQKLTVDSPKMKRKEERAFCHRKSLNHKGRQQERKQETKYPQKSQNTAKCQ